MYFHLEHLCHTSVSCGGLEIGADEYFVVITDLLDVYMDGMYWLC
jgi:hypothetical protein